MVAKIKKRRFRNGFHIDQATIRLRIIFLVSSILLGVSFVVPHLEWLTFLSLLGWFYYVDRLRQLKTRQILVDFYIGNFMVIGFAYYYLVQAAPQNWNVSLHGWFAVVSQLIAWLLVCSFCALGGLLLGWAMSRLSHHPARLIIFAGLLPIAEQVRSFLFAIISYGPGGSLAPNFNMGSIAVAASGTPLVFAARLVGWIGLSLSGVLVCLGIYYVVGRRKVVIGLALVTPVVLLALIGYRYFSVSSGNQSFKVVAVHLNESDSMETWPNFSSLPNNIDLLVLPEYSGALNNPQFKQLAQKLSATGMGVTTIAAGRPPQATNKLTFFDHNGRIINQQDKTMLIPAGEYLPYSLIASFRLIGQGKNITNFTYTQKLMPGSQPIQPVSQGSSIVGALACSGLVSPRDYTRLVNQRATVLVNTASLAFLQANSRYHVFAQNMARYQAVANARPFIQASRSGESLIVDSQGRFLTASKGQALQVLTTNIKL